MGVSGCGKTTVGKLLSQALTIPFIDADAFHPKENIQKMTNGIALTDTDRKPWLEDINQELIQQSRQKGVVLACSALKESYRKILSKDIQHIEWIYLKGDFKTIQQRMQQREHFMNVDLLQSQFDTLEAPTYGMHISIEKSPENILTEILKTLQQS
ncbi:gluconokinase [Kordia periserrulae]|uniref:Gluconokinase n=2 Tax=Kordia periserrulae TaxID=701523 RepID=A0A2T6BYD0_9FLAO|nr:gluconokinase [Kordia periserrulae]